MKEQGLDEGPQPDVLRDRPGLGAVERGAPRRRPGHDRGARYGLARRYKPFLVNTVVGFIGPEYLEDGPQITRAALEDHFMGKLLGIPMGCDACFTYHARMTQDELESLKVLLGAAGCTYLMSLPVGDDIMLNYQSTSYHDIPTRAAPARQAPDAGIRRVARRKGIWRGDAPGPMFGDVAAVR